MPCLFYSLKLNHHDLCYKYIICFYGLFFLFVGLLSMSTQIGVGLSLLADSCQAASGAVNSALAGVQNSKDSLVLVFSTQAYEHEVVLQVINDNIETCSIVGFTVAGVFTGRKVATEGIIVAVIGSEELEFYCGYEAGLSLDQDVAGSKVGQFFSNILSQTGRHSLQLLFPDGLNNRVAVCWISFFILWVLVQNMPEGCLETVSISGILVNTSGAESLRMHSWVL